MAWLLLLGAGTLAAQTPPAILVSSTALTFKTGLGQNPTLQSVFIGSSGVPITLNAASSTTTGGNWLQYSFDSGTTPANLKVTPLASSLQAGTYQGQITISSANASNTPLTISVTLIVGGPAISLITAVPNVLNFTAQLNGNPPPAQLITVGPADASVGFSVTTSTNNTTAQWLQVTPTSGNTPQLLSVSVNTQGLTGGNYTATVNIVPNAQGVGGASVVVNLAVNALPTLNLSPQAGFQFYFQTGSTALPPPQGLTVASSSGALTLTLRATTGNNLPWLVLGQTVHRRRNHAHSNSHFHLVGRRRVPARYVSGGHRGEHPRRHKSGGLRAHHLAGQHAAVAQHGRPAVALQLSRRLRRRRFRRPCKSAFRVDPQPYTATALCCLRGRTGSTSRPTPARCPRR